MLVYSSEFMNSFLQLFAVLIALFLMQNNTLLYFPKVSTDDRPSHIKESICRIVVSVL